LLEAFKPTRVVLVFQNGGFLRPGRLEVPAMGFAEPDYVDSGFVIRFDILT